MHLLHRWQLLYHHHRHWPKVKWFLFLLLVPCNWAQAHLFIEVSGCCLLCCVPNIWMLHHCITTRKLTSCMGVGSIDRSIDHHLSASYPSFFLLLFLLLFFFFFIFTLLHCTNITSRINIWLTRDHWWQQFHLFFFYCLFRYLVSYAASTSTGSTLSVVQFNPATKKGSTLATQTVPFNAYETDVLNQQTGINALLSIHPLNLPSNLSRQPPLSLSLDRLICSVGR